MYEHDTFFHLGSLARAGLVILSIIMAIITIWLAIRLARSITETKFQPLSYVARILSAIGVFWVFLWVSPQFYYAYYVMVIENLPWQWVIMNPPTLRDIKGILGFDAPHTLAQHAKTLLGWALIGSVIQQVRSTNP